MALPRPESRRLTFGVFTAEPSLGRILKDGIPVKLAPQPFKVLLLLIEHRGGMVGREEIREHLWGDSTFVDFERGINFSINQIRAALCDDVEKPRYIETLPKIGYRFIAEVTEPNGHSDGTTIGMSPLSESSDAIEPVAVMPSHEGQTRLTAEARASASSTVPRKGSLKTGASALLGLLLGGAVIWLVWHEKHERMLATVPIFRLRPSAVYRAPDPRVVETTQLTKDGRHKDATLRLLSDGTRLYFQEGAYAGPESTVAPVFAKRPSLVQVSARGGETAEIPMDLTESLVFDISPTSSELLVGGPVSKTGTPSRRELWILPLPIGPLQRVGDIIALDATWSPDGNHVVFVNGKGIFVANPDGSEIRRLATAPGIPYWVRFSPDGTRLRFTVFSNSGRPEDWDMMEMAADGSGLHHLPIHGCCGKWSADGKYYFYQTSRDIWVLPERRTFWGRAELNTPAQLTTGPVKFGAATPSANGKQLFVVGDQRRIELVRYDRKSKQLVPFLGGISAGELEVSPDGQWVVYSTYPDSNLWRSKLDGSERLQLTFSPINAHEPRWSPDGKQIVFTDVPRRLFIVSADGGRPQQVMPKGEFPNTEVGVGCWMRDGNSILFVVGTEENPYTTYQLNLKTQEVSKLPGSEGLGGGLVSRDGHYMLFGRKLYDFQTRQWSDFREGARGCAESVWSHDNKSVYQCRGNGDQLEVVRISVPDGKVERVLDLRGVTLGGYWPGWVGLLPDDSPLLMLDKSTQEIYRLDLQYQ